MPATPDHNITGLLDRWKTGDAGAGHELIDQIYPLLRQLAQQHVRRFGGALTMRPTELVNEMYEKLLKQQAVDWRNRGHLMAIAATLMRRVAVDYLRSRSAEKRGGDQLMVALDDLQSADLPNVVDCVDSMALEQALYELARTYPAVAKVAELKLFSGLSKEELASACHISTATAVRHWRFARAWLTERIAVA
jgi:RNA polymerase sigma factor (TIGR02999 family)